MTVKVSPKYQVVIPEDVRKELGIKPGMRIQVVAKGRIAYLIPETTLEEVQKQLTGTPIDPKSIRDKEDRI